MGDVDNKSDAGYKRIADALDAQFTSASRYTSENTTDYNTVYPSSIMHNKFALVLAGNSVKTVWTGSTNVSDNCMVYNNNNALVIKNDTLYDKYKLFHDHLMSTADGGTGANSSIEGVYSATVGDIPVEATFSYKNSGRSASATSAPMFPMTKIIQRVAAAEHTINFMIFTFTSTDLSSAMILRYNSGVKVEGIFDYFSQATSAATWDALSAAGIPILTDGNTYTNGSGGAKLHDKVLIIDHDYAYDSGAGATVITGSLNWTASGNTDNAENILFINSAAVAYAYYKEFLGRWQEAR